MDLDALEREVERAYKTDKEKKCAYEQQQKQRMERAAYLSSFFSFFLLHNFIILITLILISIDTMQVEKKESI